ncbi:hypothetical protein BDV97DRAFT_344536 [Delphinella strobiligena]|nr:hypothetical protein BDV97DRAFT_344536 [Delphinella strobiligena]
MEKSLNALVPHQDASGRIDPAAIQNLGMSIANQIADFLTRVTSGTLNSKPHFSRDPWSVPPLPKDAFNQTRSLDMTPRLDRYPSVMDSPGATSLWAPAPDSRRARPAKRRKTDHQPESAYHRQVPDHATSAHFDQEESDSTSTPDSRAASEMPYYGLGAHGRPLKRPPRMKFRKEEDDLLKRLRDHDGLSWQQITSHFPHRTPIALQSRYTRALKHLPRPVVIKREIIEILDGDDDFQSDATPDYTLIPPDSAHPMSLPRRQPETPLLRQALSRNLVDRDDSPLTVPDDDETDTESTSPYPAYGNAPPPPYGYPPRAYYYSQPGQQPGFAYPFSPYPPPMAMWYPQVAPPPTSIPAKAKAKGRDYHNKPEKHPRYGQFDTTQGHGSFGILRSDQPTQMVSTPQQHLIGAQTATTGAFGVLRMGDMKPKSRKLEKAMKKPNYPSHRSAKRLTPKSSSDPTHESSPLDSQASPLRSMPSQARHPDMALNDQTDPPIVRDDSEAPHETPYTQTGRSSDNSAPYPSYSIPQTKGSSSDDGIFTRAVASVQTGQESSPPLPTPPSDGTTKFSRQLPSVSRGVAPQAQMIEYSETARPSPPAAVAKNYGAAYGTPHHPHMLQTPASQSRKARGIGVVMTRATIGDPGSEDELA